MQTREILHTAWAAYLNEFTRSHTGEQMNLWVVGHGAQLLRETCALPLLGISISRGPGGGQLVDVIAGDSPLADHVRHEIRAPAGIWIALDDVGEDLSLQIDAADGTATFIDLLKPVRRHIRAPHGERDSHHPMPAEKVLRRNEGRFRFTGAGSSR